MQLTTYNLQLFFYYYYYDESHIYNFYRNIESDIQIKLKILDNNNSAYPQVAYVG